jgi:hypothetical protein
MTLHPRAMKVKRAEIELSQFLLDWAEQHELTWCEMARALTEQTQVCLKHILGLNATRKIEAKKLTKSRTRLASTGCLRVCQRQRKCESRLVLSVVRSIIST